MRSRTSSQKRTSCGVVRSGRLCFNSLALLWTREISLTGTTQQGVTFYGLSAERVATRCIFNWELLYSVCPPGGTVRTGQCREIDLASRSRSYIVQTRVLRRFHTSQERWAACKYPNGLGHHASGCEFELETHPRPLLNIWEKK